MTAQDEKFEQLAASIKAKLLASSLDSDWLISELERIVSEWRSGNLTNKKSELGAAAVKRFDSGSPEETLLLEEIGQLENLYRRRCFLGNRTTKS